MSLRASGVEVSVQRKVPATDDRAEQTVQVTVRLETSSPGTMPTSEELHEALETLAQRLETAVELSGGASGARRGPDRELEELIETYRPRQVELVDLLRADGELSTREAALLRRHVESQVAPSAAPTQSPVKETALSDRAGPPGRPVAELIATYQIESLKQAGAVRARRQISFAEYMALKRHFSALEPEVAGTSPS